mmetsp:Transcript_27642/g.38875  ORF Transcript_27642/g.38875 Transcript_27642/m.38875 type:complete len:104 (-) Transcript_27642:73-384(-)
MACFYERSCPCSKARCFVLLFRTNPVATTRIMQNISGSYGLCMARFFHGFSIASATGQPCRTWGTTRYEEMTDAHTPPECEQHLHTFGGKKVETATMLTMHAS